ncbi:MAG: tetratricopeptide repeat protein, partial [Planctomycetota bacterium]
VLVRNPSWASVKRFLTEVFEPSTVEGYYQPLPMISLMVDYALGGRPDNLMPFHHTSLCLHAFNTVLIIILLYLLFGRPAPAVLVGLLFGIHPMTVEVVAWLGERKTLLATFFSLWCLISYLGYIRTAAWKYYALCLIMYLLALMSKPTSTPLPVLLILLDYWPFRKLDVRRLLEKVPFFVVGGVFALVTAVSQGRSEYALTRIFIIVGHNITFYLCKMFAPIKQALVYPFPEPLAVSNPTILAYVIGTALLVIALLISLRWTRALLTGWLFYLLAIFPTFMVVGYSLGIAEDKYAYFPALGVLMILAWLLNRFWNQIPPLRHPGPVKAIVVTVVLVLAVSEAIATRRYLPYWQNTEKLYRHMITLAPDVPELHISLGVCLSAKGNIDESIQCYHRAIEINPNCYKAYNNLGRLLVERGEYKNGMQLLSTAVRLKPDLDKAYLNLGLAHAYQGQYDRAVPLFRQTLELNSEDFKAHYNLGAALIRLDRWNKARRHFDEAIRLNREHADSYFGIGLVMAHQGRFDKATQAYKQALRIDPNHQGASKNLNTLSTMPR